MNHNGNFRKTAKIFILVFLCCEMQSTFTQQHSSNNLARVNVDNEIEAAQQDARHQASIRLIAQDRVFGEGHICGGAIIAPSVVLTVGQCVFDYDNLKPRHPAELKVVMGNVNRYLRNGNTLVYGVTHVHRPHTFDPHRLRDNVAVIMLSRDIPAQHATVQPIALNVALSYDASAPSNAFELTSWGATAEGVPTAQLMSLKASRSSDQQCLLQYGSLYTVGMLCMDLRAANAQLETCACPQDAGAPLIYENKLWGLTALGNGCAARNLPVVYMDVAYHSGWILHKIGDGHNQNSSFWGTLAFLMFTGFALKTSRIMKF